MAARKIIKIDEEKCNGCGLCIPGCKEGALQVIGGKARLVSDSFCDGFGACIGHCPQGAISIEERQAEEYDERKARAHLSHGGCPGSKIMDFRKKERVNTEAVSNAASELSNWPVQIMLVPSGAPYLNNADILIAADCVAFAYPDFQRLLKGKTLLVGCPKLDDALIYERKIAEMLERNNIRSITCAYMEVPCCFGLAGIIGKAVCGSGKNTPYEAIMISIKGERLK